MSTKVKGLLKGLRYISQVFDEKEDEIQIGFPTDVKHVAHIGSDDPSATAPSWMTEFKTASDPSSETVNPTETNEDNKNSKGRSGDGIRIPRSRHHSIDNTSQTNSSTKRSSEGSKHTRRHRSSDASSESSSVRDRESSGGSRHSRRNRSSTGPESLSQELPSGEGSRHKHSHHRRKSKTTSEDGSVKRSSRTRRSSKGSSMSDISLADLGSGQESAHGPKET